MKLAEAERSYCNCPHCQRWHFTCPACERHLDDVHRDCDTSLCYTCRNYYDAWKEKKTGEKETRKRYVGQFLKELDEYRLRSKKMLKGKGKAIACYEFTTCPLGEDEHIDECPFDTHYLNGIKCKKVLGR